MAPQCCRFRQDIAAEVLANFALQATELLSGATGKRVNSLREAVLVTRPRLSRRTTSQIQRLNDAYKVVRHLSSQYADDLLRQIALELATNPKTEGSPGVLEQLSELQLHEQSHMSETSMQEALLGHGNELQLHEVRHESELSVVAEPQVEGLDLEQKMVGNPQVDFFVDHVQTNLLHMPLTQVEIVHLPKTVTVDINECVQIAPLTQEVFVHMPKTTKVDINECVQFVHMPKTISVDINECVQFVELIVGAAFSINTSKAAPQEVEKERERERESRGEGGEAAAGTHATNAVCAARALAQPSAGGGQPGQDGKSNAQRAVAEHGLPGVLPIRQEPQRRFDLELWRAQRLHRPSFGALRPNGASRAAGLPDVLRF